MKVKNLIETCKDFSRINIWTSNNDYPISYIPTDAKEIYSVEIFKEIYSVEILKAIPEEILNAPVSSWYMTNDILTIYI